MKGVWPQGPLRLLLGARSAEGTSQVPSRASSVQALSQSLSLNGLEVFLL